jgi:hypothetical protein
MENIKHLTPEEINEFCNETIPIIQNYRDEGDYYLCTHLANYLKEHDLIHWDRSSIDVYYPKFISKFTNDNAVTYANARIANSNEIWWRGNLSKKGYDCDNRILFLEWIKSQYPVTPEE